VYVPDDKWEKLDTKAIEGHFVGLSQNKKGYIVSNSDGDQRELIIEQK